MAKLIGTAGHVDHGKTTLIRALTGIDADRLPEEKQRGMTIDVGFAYIDLPGHGRVSIVDVPGHERFITNMLVGALGIDVALLCVAADESVMPQTREHFQILELLPVDKMVVALTRADMADEETQSIARAEVEELLAGTRFQGSPIIPVSAITGAGVPELKSALAEALTEQAPDVNAPWYLPIDRAFSVKGHGCVVTGTLAQGVVKNGDSAFLEPGHREVRIRAIHVHGQSVERSEEGRRTALNLSGVRLEEVARGQAAGAPGALFETKCFDARMRWLVAPKHASRVRVSVGADEVIGKLFLSRESEEICQVRLDRPIACALDQPVILRRYSPPVLLGGGRIVVPLSHPRRRSERATVISAGDERQGILQAIGESPDGVPTEEICRMLGKTPQTLGDVFERLQEEGAVLSFGGLWFQPAGFSEGADRFLRALAELHEASPTQSWIPREKVVAKAGLKWEGKPLDRILSALSIEEHVRVSGTGVRHPQFTVQLSARQRQFLDRVVGELEKRAVDTPSGRDLARILSVPPQAVEEILRVGLDAGELITIGEGIFYTPKQIESIKEKILSFAKGKPFPASAVRDHLGTTRKYVIPLLEYLDSQRFTLRLGDQRVIQDQRGG